MRKMFGAENIGTDDTFFGIIFLDRESVHLQSKIASELNKTWLAPQIASPFAPPHHLLGLNVFSEQASPLKNRSRFAPQPFQRRKSEMIQNRILVLSLEQCKSVSILLISDTAERSPVTCKIWRRYSRERTFRTPPPFDQRNNCVFITNDERIARVCTARTDKHEKTFVYMIDVKK